MIVNLFYLKKKHKKWLFLLSLLVYESNLLSKKDERNIYMLTHFVYMRLNYYKKI